jgi:threonine aldolase
MALHLDGARVWNAAAALGTPLRAFTADAGVDVLSLGGTKNGLLGAEAIIVLDPAKSPGLTYLRKMNMQLASKMRFISAQLLTLFDDDLGIRSATHANAMAARLRAGLDGMLAAGEIPAEALRFSQPTMANAVFALIGNDAADRIRERVRFYDWDRARGEVRWMCAFDTTEANVDAFLGVLREELNR